MREIAERQKVKDIYMYVILLQSFIIQYIKDREHEMKRERKRERERERERERGA